MYSGNSSASTSAAGEDLLLSGEYEVFLSFYGEDTRYQFTDFLYTFLISSGVRTFRDNEELRVGEEIGPELLKAIKDSKISIPIFSKNYASSKWCLLELTQMVECQAEAKGEKMIFPVFYDVEPCDVRHQSGEYFEEAFRQHEKKKRLDEKTVQSWKEALTKVGQLKGLELKKETGGREGELAKIVVKEVLSKLQNNYTHVPKNLVGMDNHIEELERRLKVDSDGLRIVGIHGMGGLGKTTMAKVIYNQLCHHFEGHCFLDDVREKSRPLDGIVKLQKQLISKILQKKVQKFSDANVGRNRIRGAVGRRKVLIVLDDVDQYSQVDQLMGQQSWFGAQSRIIITTRETKVLDAVEKACQIEGLLDVYESYKPDFMDDDYALQLFSKHAFMRDSPMEGYESLCKEVVDIAKGLPLVLAVLGPQFFVERDKDVWEEKLRKLRGIPDNNVLEKLKFSYDALRYQERQIFLDIACLFIGYDKTKPCYMWDDCRFYPKEGISILVSKSLITVGDDIELQMHDQLRDLGRQIVREEGLNEPGKRSRFWDKDEDEAIHILKTRQGTSSVNVLHLPYYDHSRAKKKMKTLDAQYFHNLPNLRYLFMTFEHDLDGDFEHLLSNLKWLRWIWSGKFKPTNITMTNLVILDLSFSEFTEKWEGWSELKKAKKLKVLDLSWCSNIEEVPHLSTCTSLEILRLFHCRSLVRLDGLEQLKSLTFLNASYCKKLETLPSLPNLTKFVELYLCGCDKLKQIQGLEKFESLEVLDIGKCRSLETLPTFSNFKKLKTFNAEGCKMLIEFQGLDRLESLEWLSISDCAEVREIPDLRSLKNLKELNISFLNKLTGIRGLEELKSLELLNIRGCHSIEALPDFSNFEKLIELDASWCLKVTEIRGLEELKSLKRLCIIGCPDTWTLPDLPNTKIQQIHPCPETPDHSDESPEPTDCSGSESPEPTDYSESESE